MDSTRAHASLFFCSIVEEPFASVNRVDWNRPQPGAPSASPTADPVPSRMAAEKALARVSSDRAPLARWGCPRRVWGHTPNSGAVTFPGSLHRRYPGSSSDLRRRIGCSWHVVATCMYERVRRTGATGARPWGAYSKFRDDHTPPKPSQKASTLDLGPAEANRVLQKCRSARKRMSAYRAPAPLVASGRQWSPLVIKDPHAQDIAAAGGPQRPC